jgi:hypothetical protein
MRSEVVQYDTTRLGMARQNSIGTLVAAVTFTLLYGRLSFRAPVSRQRCVPPMALSKSNFVTA